MNAPVVVVTGANGLVGAHVCAALLERGASVRGLVRRAGTAPSGVEEVTDAERALRGADAVVTTVHPMGSDLETQRRVGVEGTVATARAAVAAGVERLVHLSSTSVYDRSPGVGDVDEFSALASDDSGDYKVTKRDADLALAGVEGLTRILARPPCVLGRGETSVWNTLRPRELRDDPASRHAVPDETFAWVHARDLAAALADLALGSYGPPPGACEAVNLAAGNGSWRDYYGAVAEALGVEMTWDVAPAWTGRILTDRARAWGWTPTTSVDEALAELAAALRPVE